MGGTCSINVDEVRNQVHLAYILQHAVSCNGNIFSNSVFLFVAFNFPALNVLQSWLCRQSLVCENKMHHMKASWNSEMCVTSIVGVSLLYVWQMIHFILTSTQSDRQEKFRPLQKGKKAEKRRKNKRMARWKKNKIHERNKKTYDIPQRPVSRVSDIADNQTGGLRDTPSNICRTHRGNLRG